MYIKITLILLFNRLEARGKISQTLRDNNIDSPGPNRKRPTFDLWGITSSFVNSLIASLKGWGTPAKPTLFGPLRNCLYPKIFRSSNVMKATLIRTGITRIK